MKHNILDFVVGNFLRMGMRWIQDVRVLLFVCALASLENGFCNGEGDRPLTFAYHDADVDRNVSELITSKGYPCEEYAVVTEDGFILGLQRIPHGLHEVSGLKQRPVVFLQHGLLDSAATWVINSETQSLGFILADAGFDVWLGNVRGNTYSKRHVNLSPDDSRFWAWSWDEMAKYDLPAMLKFVLAKTGQADLFYIGHSQGTIIAFAGFSRDPQLAKQVKAFIALGPVITVGNIEGAARLLVKIVPEVAFLFKLFGVNDFLPSSALMRLLALTLCHDSLSRYLCEDVLFLIAGHNSQEMNVSRLPVYISHTPAGSSVQNMVHFAQMVKSKKCQMYDYGSDEQNMLHYNTTSPPSYNMSTFDVPTYVYSGGQDILADQQDVKWLLSQIRSVKKHREIPAWEHLDFIWSFKANTILYQEIVQILQKQIP